MTIANLRIVPRNFWDLMTLSAAPAEATGFEIIKTQSLLRQDEWRSTSTASQTLHGTMASGSFSCNCFFMFGHHCHGGTIQVRGYTTTNWTGTPAFDTTAIPVYTAINTGYDAGYSDYPGADTHDPLGMESPFFVYFTPATGVKSVQIDLTSKSTTYGFNYWSISRPFIGMYREAEGNADFSTALGTGDASKIQRSGGGSVVPLAGARWRMLDFDFNYVTQDEMPALLDHMDQNQQSKDMVVSLFPGEGGRKERDHTVCGVFTALDAIGRIADSVYGKKKFRIAGI